MSSFDSLLTDTPEWLRPDDQRSYRFSSAFQPIRALESLDLYGYEALLRVQRRPFMGWMLPQTFLSTLSSNAAQLLQADCDFLKFHITQAAPLRASRDIQLFLNLEPTTFLQVPESLLPEEFLKHWQWRPEQIVLEVTERWNLHENVEKWARAGAILKNRGFGLALDDWDLSPEGFELIEAFQPDYVKIALQDIPPIDPADLGQSALKQGLRQLASRSIHCIVEGIETASQYAALQQLNIPWGQGYWLGPPILRGKGD